MASPTGHHPHGGHQLLARHVLEEEAARARLHGVVDVLVEVERREHEHAASASPRRPGAGSPRCRPWSGHPDVHQHDVGRELGHLAQADRAVRRLPHHLDVVRELRGSSGSRRGPAPGRRRAGPGSPRHHASTGAGPPAWNPPAGVGPASREPPAAQGTFPRADQAETRSRAPARAGRPEPSDRRRRCGPRRAARASRLVTTSRVGTVPGVATYVRQALLGNAVDGEPEPARQVVGHVDPSASTGSPASSIPATSRGRSGEAARGLALVGLDVVLDPEQVQHLAHVAQCLARAASDGPQRLACAGRVDGERSLSGVGLDARSR